MRVFCIILIILFNTLPLYSEFQNNSRGEISAESRVFENDNDSQTEDIGLGMFSRLQVGLKNNLFQSSICMTGRIDHYDSDRNFINLEEAWIGIKSSYLFLKVGNHMFNWSAAQAFQPVDIINSRNYDSNIENADKIGEPAASLKINIFSGNIFFAYMPYYQKPNWPGESSRVYIGGELPGNITMGANKYIDHDGMESTDKYGHQGAIRITQSFSEFDISFHTIYHLDRNITIPSLDLTNNQIYPIFQRKIQYGGTLQYVFGSAVFRSEFVYRHYYKIDNSVKEKYVNPLTMNPIEETVDHVIVSAGIDYEFNLYDLGMMTLMLEAQRLIGVSKKERESIETFQSDVLFGIIFARNDYLNKMFSFTCIIDTERAYQVLLNANYSQRINDVLGFSIGLRRIIANNNDDKVTGLEALDDANSYTFQVSRYF